MQSQQPDSASDGESQAEEETSNTAGLPALTMAETTTFLEFSSDALLVADARGTLVLVNCQATRMFGYAQTDLPGQPWNCLCRNACARHMTLTCAAMSALLVGVRWGWGSIC